MKMSELKEVDAIKSKARAKNQYCLLRGLEWREHLLTDLLIPDRSFSCVPAVTSHRKAMSGDDICLHRRLRCECMVCCKITRREERPGKGDVECIQEQSKSRKNSYLTYILIVPAAIAWLSCGPDQRDRLARIECSCARATCDQKGLHCLKMWT